MRKKELVEITITTLFIIILLFVLTGLAKKKGQRKVAKGNSVTQEENISSQEKQRPFLSLEEEAAKLELRRDPFSAIPILSGKASPSGLYLSGIAWDKEKPTAIINNQIVGIGDNIDGNKVVDIKKDRVILNSGTQKIELKIE